MIGIDGDEGEAARPRAGEKLFQPRVGSVGRGAVIRSEENHEDFAVLEVGEAVCFAVDAGQREIGS